MSSYNPDAIERHFDSYGAQEWERLERTPVDQVSLHIHTHYLQQHVNQGDRTLEIGAGAGRFTRQLAEIGAQIVVADISAEQLRLNQHFANKYGFSANIEQWQKLDICDLSAFSTGSFDRVIAYGGPFSYVLDQRDRALSESLRLLKPGGKLLLSVMSLWGTVHRYLDGTLLVPADCNQKITQSGDLTASNYPARKGNHMHLFQASELRSWLSQTKTTVLAMSASNSLSLGWEDMLTAMQENTHQWNELLRMELEACASEGCLNMGTHIIAIAQKNA